MNLIGLNAKKATLEKINTKIKNKVLKRYASLLNKEKYSIIRANIKDIDFAQIKRLSAPIMKYISNFLSLFK